MILPYSVRLLCLCLASFFVVNALCSLTLRFFSRAALQLAETKTAAAASRLLLVLRLLPVSLAAVFVFGLCAPSYLWLEPGATDEKVGALCILFAALGGLVCFLSVARTIRALLHSLRYHYDSRLAGSEAQDSGPSPLLVIEREAPIVALSGLFRPRLLVSRGVLRALSGAELDAALAHERAHRFSRDNLKRLFLLLAPDSLPFLQPLQSLERAWSRFAEWAADDLAANGDPLRAASLAAALVRVARMGTPAPLPQVATSLLACDRDLSARVARLLVTAPGALQLSTQPPSFLRRPSYWFAASFGVGLIAPLLLSPVHQLLERFLR